MVLGRLQKTMKGHLQRRTVTKWKQQESGVSTLQQMLRNENSALFSLSLNGRLGVLIS